MPDFTDGSSIVGEFVGGGTTFAPLPDLAPTQQDPTQAQLVSEEGGALFGPPRQKLFYPSFEFAGGSRIDFPDHAADIKVSGNRIRGQNLSLGGVQETLSVRMEYRLLIAYRYLPTAMMAQLWDWWQDYASLGFQTAITLDRFNTCAGQWEYDRFNTFFDKAECQNDPMEPVRAFPSRPFYTYAFVFRQGQ